MTDTPRKKYDSDLEALNAFHSYLDERRLTEGGATHTDVTADGTAGYFTKPDGTVTTIYVVDKAVYAKEFQAPPKAHKESGHFHWPMEKRKEIADNFRKNRSKYKSKEAFAITYQISAKTLDAYLKEFPEVET